MSADAEVVLVWASRGRDAALTVQLLERHALAARQCDSMDNLVKGIGDAGCAIVTAEILTRSIRDALATALAAQPAWSDFPIVLFAPHAAHVAERELDEVKLLGNVAILERPVHPNSLISAVLAALRARRRQYEARDAIRRRDQFLAMLGHELRNPLAAIVLALETMPAASTQDKQRTVIERQVSHLTRLVDDLLDVARVTSGKVRLETAPLDLVEVVRRCLQSAELAARAREIELVYVGANGPLMIDGDLVRLEEIFHNLMTNAIKYSPRGARVELRIVCDAAACTVAVADHGIGIAPEMLPRVFELFAQADGSLARSQGGLGVGLTLVKSLVDLHGGTITAQSAGLGRGSTFTVCLPRARTAPRRTAPRHAAAVDRRLRVVLVDDNHDVLDLTRELLEHYGCRVATAPDGPAGLALLLAEQPDLAFVDIGLPGLDGFGVAAQARARHLERTYLVAMSGYGQPGDRQRALAAGFDRHLTKPVTAAMLREAMATAAHKSGDSSLAPA